MSRRCRYSRSLSVPISLTHLPCFPSFLFSWVGWVYAGRSHCCGRRARDVPESSHEPTQGQRGLPCSLGQGSPAPPRPPTDAAAAGGDSAAGAAAARRWAPHAEVAAAVPAGAQDEDGPRRPPPPSPPPPTQRPAIPPATGPASPALLVVVDSKNSVKQ
uniref:Uncharacterized protein n=1 Tax=Anthurium amnicola TaxID=1678845 RepID=A0A1D1XWC9_9ARAE